MIYKKIGNYVYISVQYLRVNYKGVLCLYKI